MSITLAQLRTQARDRADMTNSLFITDSELNNYLNASIAELHDLMLACYDSDYYLLSDSFSTVNGTENYALPTDFYKLRGVDVSDGGDEYISLRPFNFNERNSKNEISSYAVSGGYFRYRLAGSNLMLNPVPTGTYNIRIWYAPLATKLVADGDTLDDLNQFSEYVIVDAAIKMMQKEESDVSVLMAQKGDIRKRIENMAQNRDAGQPESVSDIYAENNDYYFYFTD